MSSSEAPATCRGGVSLRAVARVAIGFGLREKGPPELDPARYPTPLRERRASFVTLRRGGELRGCTGSLDAADPLVVDVAKNTFRSAFRDPRFLTVEDVVEALAYDIQLDGLG